MFLRSGNRELMRDLNRSLVLTLIKNRGPLSRTDLAGQSGLAQGTMTNIVRDLLEAGLVRETANAPSTGGRRPILLEIDPSGGYALGLKLTQDRAILALTDLDGTVTYSTTERSGDPRDLPSYVAHLGDVILDILRRSAVAREKLVGIGIGLPGFIDHEAGVCRHSALLGWHEVPLRELLEAPLAAPVVLDNDVNTLALYEALYGTGKGLSDFLVVTLGRGVGMGAFANGRMIRGGRGGAGEFGHVSVQPDGPLCNCGNRGCLEALVGDLALVTQAQQAGLPAQMPEELLALAQAGDPTALAIFTTAGTWLGRGVAALVNIFNPTHLIVSGEGARASQFLFAPMEQTLKAHVFNGLADDMSLLMEPLTDDVWARGAASLALNELFSPQIYGGRGRDDGRITGGAHVKTGAGRMAPVAPDGRGTRW
jgi:N-acetylglucosamine repressor